MKNKIWVLVFFFLFFQLNITSCGMKKDNISSWSNKDIQYDSEKFTTWKATDIQLADVAFKDFTLAEVQIKGATYGLLQSSDLDVLIQKDSIELLTKSGDKYLHMSILPISISKYLGYGEVTFQKIDLTKDNKEDLVAIYTTGGTGMKQTIMYVVDGITLQQIPLHYNPSEFESFVTEFRIKSVEMKAENAMISVEVIDKYDNIFSGISAIPKGAYQTDMKCYLASDLMDIREIRNNGKIKVGTSFAIVSDVVNYVGDISGNLSYDDNKNEFFLDEKSVMIDLIN